MRNSIAIICPIAPVLTGTTGTANAVVNLDGTNLLSTFKILQSTMAKGVLTVSAPGTKGYTTTTFALAYAVGDQLRLTITVPSSSQKVIKTFVHTVPVGGATVTAIASAFAALITAAKNEGFTQVFSAISALGVLTVTFSDVNTGAFNTVSYTNSATGTAVTVATPTVKSEGTAADLLAAGIPASKIVLAAYDTYRFQLKADAATPFIDSKGTIVKEVIWFGVPGQGTVLDGFAL
jgi:hypothetical protein